MMDRKNSMLTWRTRDIVLFILFIVGLALLLIYGSKAIAGANDRRNVEGWRNSPVAEAEIPTLQTTTPPAVLANVIPMEQAEPEPAPARSGVVISADSNGDKSESKSLGNKAGILKRTLPQLLNKSN